jgi:hypothetical protein
MKLTIPNKENHYALWNWLANNPKADKNKWPGFKTILKYNNKTIRSHCFACESCLNKKEDKCDCFNKCPIRDECSNDFPNWIYAENKRERWEFALKMRDAWK